HGAEDAHPVAIYATAVALGIAGLLWYVLQQKPAAGRTAAIGLMLGGGAAFVLDMLTQPSWMFSGWLLDPGQVVALAAMLAGALLWTFTGHSGAPAEDFGMQDHSP